MTLFSNFIDKFSDEKKFISSIRVFIQILTFSEKSLLIDFQEEKAQDDTIYLPTDNGAGISRVMIKDLNYIT
jgi:hypothetical protein